MRFEATSLSWALETFPEPWHATVEQSMIWSDDGSANGENIFREVRRFVLWAAACGRIGAKATGDLGMAGSAEGNRL